MRSKLCVINSVEPEVLTKQYSLVNGELKKTASAHMIRGNAEVFEVADAHEFANLLTSLKTNQALTFGVPDCGDCEIVTKDAYNKLGQPSGFATRTNDHFHFSPGPGIMMLDYDPSEGVKPYSRDELIAALEYCCKGITSGGWVWMPSSSSYIFDEEGNELQGLRGQRMYIFVQSAADIPRAGELLAEKMWLHGFGRIEISTSGSRLIRSMIDTSVFQASRLDFASGADCGDGVKQMRGQPYVNVGDPIDSVSIIAHKKLADRKQAKQLIDDALKSAQEQANRVRKDYVQDRAVKEAGSNASQDEVQKVVERITKALETDNLESDFLVFVMSEGKLTKVSVSDILDAPRKYHGMQCLDPAEPGYRNGQATGIIYSDSDNPNIFSLAHGGRVFRMIKPGINVDPYEPAAYGIEVHCMLSNKGERTYFWKEGDRYIPVTRIDAPNHLLRAGVPDEVLPNGLKLTDEILLRMQMENPLAYAGEIAGYDAGVHTINNTRVLSTANVCTPESYEGDWSTLGMVMSGLFPDGDNRKRFMAACYFYWKSLHERKWMPLPVLCLCGPRESGKTLAVNVLNMMLGDRPFGKGYRYLCGATSFNADLLKSVLLVCDDEMIAKDMRSRAGMAQAFKQMSVDNKHRIEAKGVDAFTISPAWRIIVCCNDEAESMQVLPPVDHGLADKFLLLRCVRSEMPMATATPSAREAFHSALRREIGPFLYAMERSDWINQYAGKRMQVEGWQDPVLLNRLNGLSNEIGLLELVDTADIYSTVSRDWVGTASELEAELTSEDSTRHKARSLLSWPRACGTYLSRLCSMEPDRVEVIDEGYQKKAKRYRIVRSD